MVVREAFSVARFWFNRRTLIGLVLTLAYTQHSHADFTQTIQEAQSQYRNAEISSAQGNLERLLEKHKGKSTEELKRRFAIIENLGYLYIQTGDIVGLNNLVGELLSIGDSRPWNDLALKFRISGLTLIGQTTTALAELEKAYESLPRHPTRSLDGPGYLTSNNSYLGVSYAMLLAREGRRTDADFVVHRAVVGAAVEKNINPYTAFETLLKLAEYYLETGRLDRGGRLLATLSPYVPVFINPNTPEHLYWLKLLIHEWSWRGGFSGYEYLVDKLASLLAHNDGKNNPIRLDWVSQALWAWKILAAENDDPQRFLQAEALEEKYFPTAQYASPYTKADAIFYRTRYAYIGGHPLPDFPADELLAKVAGPTNHFPEMLHLARANHYQVRGELEKAVQEGSKAFTLLRDKYHGAQLPNLWTVQPYRFVKMATENLVELVSLTADQGKLKATLQPAIVADAVDTLIRLKSPAGAYFAGARREIDSELVRATIKRRELFASQYEQYVDSLILRLATRVENYADWRPLEPTPETIEQEKTGYLDFVNFSHDLYTIDQHIWRAAPKYFSNSRLSVIDPATLKAVAGRNNAIIWLTFIQDELLQLCFNGTDYFIGTAKFNLQDLKNHIRQMRTTLTAYQKVDELDQSMKFRGFSVRKSTPQPVSGFIKSSRELFDHVFEGLEECTKGKTKLLLRVDPVFYSLPINALLVSHKEGRAPEWFFDKYAYEFLSSINPAEEQKFAGAKSQPSSSHTLLGFGDFVPHSGSPVAQKNSELMASRSTPEIIELESLPPLPYTRFEIQELGRLFTEESSSLFLGKEATEKNFRQARPETYSTIAFATHALVAGEFEGLREPALVLSKGEKASPYDDGLLTASEVRSIGLNADLVLLSACNTAMSDGTPNAQGLSILADGFLFSGAKAIVASQWPVQDQVAPIITNSLVKSLSEKGKVGEALQDALKSFVNDDSLAPFHHPSFWAPFIPITQGTDESPDSIDASPVLVKDWEFLNEKGQLAEALTIATNDRKSKLAVQGFQHPNKETKPAHGWLEVLDIEGSLQYRLDFAGLAAGGDVLFNSEGDLLSTWSTGAQYGVDQVEAILLKTDSAGAVVWRKQFATEGLTDLPQALVKLGPDRYAVVVSVENLNKSEAPKSQIWLWIVDDKGATESKLMLETIDWVGDLAIEAINVSGGRLVVSRLDPSKSAAYIGNDPVTATPKGVMVFRPSTKMMIVSTQRNNLLVQTSVEMPVADIHDLYEINGKIIALASTISDEGARVSGVTVYEMDPDTLEMTEKLEFSGASALFPRKVIVTESGNYVVVGYFQNNNRRKESASRFEEGQMINYLMGVEFEPDQSHSSFVSTFDKDGRFLDDMVGVSPTGAALIDAVSIGENQFIAVGSGGKQGSAMAQYSLH